VIVEKSDRWVVEAPTAGLRVVRFEQPVLFPDVDESLYDHLWERTAAGMGEDEVIILNFAQVRHLTSGFLRWLFRAHGQMKPRRSQFIGCCLEEELRDVFFVVGLSQPLDWLLNYVSSEEAAMDKARALLQRT